jgi:stress response protein YsnF
VSSSGSTSGGGLHPATADSSGTGTSRDALPVLEEKAVLEKDVVTTGRVRVTTHTTLVDEIATASLEGQAVDVRRIPIGKPILGELPQIRTAGDTTIVPVLEEVLVVEKRLMLKEELHIRCRGTVEQVTVPVQLRKQEADVQRVKE